MPTWLVRKVGGLPVWAWPTVLVGGFLAYRYVKSKQTANAANSGTAIPIGGSPFNYPDWAQPDAGNLLPTSQLPTTAQTTTNTGGGGGGGAASSPPPKINTASPGSVNSLSPERINLANPPPNYYGPGQPHDPTQAATKTNTTTPHANFYSAMPTSAMATTANSHG